jgi:hypothetical protein
MAGFTTSPRRWMVPTALLTAMLASFGGRDVITTKQSGAGRGSYWQCPECHRVEWKLPGPTPRCAGVPKGTHAIAKTKRMTGDDIQKTDSGRYFF